MDSIVILADPNTSIQKIVPKISKNILEGLFPALLPSSCSVSSLFSFSKPRVRGSNPLGRTNKYNVFINFTQPQN